MSYYFHVTWFETVKDHDDAEPRRICVAKRYDAGSYADAERLLANVNRDLLYHVPPGAVTGDLFYEPIASSVYQFQSRTPGAAA